MGVHSHNDYNQSQLRMQALKNKNRNDKTLTTERLVEIGVV